MNYTVIQITLQIHKKRKKHISIDKNKLNLVEFGIVYKCVSSYFRHELGKKQTFWLSLLGMGS